MSDHDIAPDPIDKVYLQAEALLGDEAARASRRARALAAVAREVVGPAAAPALARPPIWRSGRWLVAACLAGLAALVGIQIYPILPHKPELRQVALVTPPPGRATASLPEQAPRTRYTAPAHAALAVPQRATTPLAHIVIAPSVSPAPLAPRPSAAPPQAGVVSPPTLAAPPAPGATVQGAPPSLAGVSPPSSALAASAPSQSSLSEVVVTAEMRRPSEAAADPAARLRGAAAAGRLAQIKVLLDEGVPVDAEDADGDTALMKSIQADQVDSAAVLSHRGASLDHKNHAGVSARDMATTQGDPALDEALGLKP
jgi:hypothetical protein